MKGTITKLVPLDGYGFIACDERDMDGLLLYEREFFFHRSQMPIPSAYHDLRAGTEVTFEAEESERGPRAVRVMPAQSDEKVA